MLKITLPSVETMVLIFEDLTIPSSPDVPASSEDHLIEKRLMKVSSCSYGDIPHGVPLPLYLEIIPNSVAEHASEKQTIPILFNPCMA